MKINLANIKKAQKLLNKNECVAIPTETVYGLAGNAYSDIACKKDAAARWQEHFLRWLRGDSAALLDHKVQEISGTRPAP